MSAPAPGATHQPVGVVVDTNIVSFLLKQDTRAAAYAPHLINRISAVSFATIAELDAWADIAHWGQQRRNELELFLQPYFVHFPDRDVCRLWGYFRSEARRAGRSIEAGDGWIAVTALYYQVPLVTHNPSDFIGVPGLVILTAVRP